MDSREYLERLQELDRKLLQERLEIEEAFKNYRKSLDRLSHKLTTVTTKFLESLGSEDGDYDDTEQELIDIIENEMTYPNGEDLAEPFEDLDYKIKKLRDAIGAIEATV